MARIVSIIGTDGSGKTTLADEVVRQLTDGGVSAAREWLGAESVLMALPRRLLHRVWGRGLPRRSGSSGAGDYRHELRTKQAVVQRYAGAVPVYVQLVMVDYKAQIALKLRRTRGLEALVADRYLFDVAVNLGLTLGWSPDRVVEFVRNKLSDFPVPVSRVYVRVEPEVSMSRKDDVSDINYLRERLAYYDAIAAAFHFITLDGTRPIAENADRVVAEVNASLKATYVHYVHSNNEDVGGADRVLALLAAEVSKPIHLGGAGEVRAVVSLRERTQAVDLHEALGNIAIVTPFVRPQVSAGSLGILRSLARAPFSLWHFWALFGRERPDIVHVNDLYDVIPAVAGRARGLPVVYHIRMIATNRHVRRLFQFVIPRISAVSISVSEAVRDHYFKDDRTHHRPLVIHDHARPVQLVDPGAVERPGLRPSGLSEGGRLVVMVGRLEPWKGQHVFLRALDLLPPGLRDRHVFAVVGGEVPGKQAYATRVYEQARRLGVVVLGERDDVPELLRAADISVHCSTSPDPFPGVVVESLLAGCATVAADAGGVPEILGDPAVGLLIAPGDEQGLATALADLLDGPAPRARYGRSSRAQALGLVDSQDINTALLSVYRALRSR